MSPRSGHIFQPCELNDPGAHAHHLCTDWHYHVGGTSVYPDGDWRIW